VPQLPWDASALVKRFYTETGSDTVNALFTFTPALQMASTYISYAETASILRRRFNRGDITLVAFNAVRNALANEVLHSADVSLMSVDDTAVLAGIALSDAYNINSSDAAILAVFLRYARSLPPTDPACVLVASDQRLLRAAAAEGLTILNPELLAVADVAAFLASLA